MAINFINGKPGDGMNQYIVFQQFINTNGSPTGSGQYSNPLSFKESAKRFREAREFRDGCEFSGCMAVKVGVVRVPSNYDSFISSWLSLSELCSLHPQVSVTCLSKTIGAA